ncbi:MAG: radical SAM protein [Candidatus Omnitrophota bacterium]
MKTLLIYPPCSILFANPKATYASMPLGLSCLSAYLKKEGHEVSILDLNIKMYFDAKEKDKKLWHRKNWNFWNNGTLFFNKILPRLQDIQEKWVDTLLESGFGIIGFYISCTSQWMALSLAKRLKEKNKDIAVIFGGPDCSRENAERFLKTADVDAVVMGEGEITLSQIVSSFEKTGQIKPCPGALFRENGEIVYGGQRELIENLDTLPYPDFSDFIDDYKILFKDSIQLSISWVRGCTHRCTFCYESRFWGSPRPRSPESICREFISQKQKYNVSAFYKGDSILAFSEELLFKTCDLLIENGGDIFWGSQARLENYLTPESLQKLYKAGCRYLWYGLESGSQSVLDKMNKGLQVRQAQDIIINTKKAGISTCLFIIVGSPGETIIDFIKTVWFILRNSDFIDYILVTSAEVSITSDWYLNPEKYGIVMEKKHYYHWRTKYYLNNQYGRAIGNYTLNAIYRMICYPRKIKKYLGLQ